MRDRRVSLLAELRELKLQANGIAPSLRGRVDARMKEIYDELKDLEKEKKTIVSTLIGGTTKKKDKIFKKQMKKRRDQPKDFIFT